MVFHLPASTVIIKLIIFFVKNNCQSLHPIYVVSVVFCCMEADWFVPTWYPEAKSFCGSNAALNFIVVTLPSAGHISKQQLLKQEFQSHVREYEVEGEGNETTHLHSYCQKLGLLSLHYMFFFNLLLPRLFDLWPLYFATHVVIDSVLVPAVLVCCHQVLNHRLIVRLMLFLILVEKMSAGKAAKQDADRQKTRGPEEDTAKIV